MAEHILTLADMNARGDTPAIVYNLQDEIRRDSPFLDMLPFDASVSNNGGGGSLVYGYPRLESTRPAHTRQINTDVPDFVAKRKMVLFGLVPIAASFALDRVTRKLGAIDEQAFQMREANAACRQKFTDLAVNGVFSDFDSEVPEFDGIDALVSGTIMESKGADGNAHDFRSINTYDKAADAEDVVKSWLRNFDGTPTIFLVNNDGADILDRINTRLSRQQERAAYGAPIPTFRSIPYVHVGMKATTIVQDDIIAGTVGEEDIITTTDGVTSIYAVRLGEDGMHGVLPLGFDLVQEFEPNWSGAGAVKRGEVEYGPTGLALKKRRAAGVLRVRVR